MSVYRASLSFACCLGPVTMLSARNLQSPPKRRFTHHLSSSVQPPPHLASRNAAAAALLRHASSLPSLPLVASLHAAVLRRGAVALLAPSLIHGYSASGDLASARDVFDELPPGERTLSARTALASAASAHGRCHEALGLFSGAETEMDDKAVTVLLAACARAGMVEEGRRVFARLCRPALQHYTCMVEMLGRTGEVEEAERMLAGMEARPDRVICAALLAACQVHGRVDVAERVSRLMRQYGIA